MLEVHKSILEQNFLCFLHMSRPIQLRNAAWQMPKKEWRKHYPPKGGTSSWTATASKKKACLGKLFSQLHLLFEEAKQHEWLFQELNPKESATNIM